MRAEMIIPKSPSAMPVVPLEERPIDSLTLGESRELNRRQRLTRP